MNKPNPQVDGYLRKNKPWQREMAAIRAILLDSELVEEVKWRIPCYTVDGGNVCSISALKEYAALGFFKGSLLKDPRGILIAPGENTRSARLVKFTSVEQVNEQRDVLKAYIDEAIANERQGLRVDFTQNADVPVPEELEAKCKADPAFKAAFEALTPGRRRFYLLHFGEAKQSKTRMARIERCTERIFKGLGFND